MKKRMKPSAICQIFNSSLAASFFVFMALLFPSLTMARSSFNATYFVTNNYGQALSFKQSGKTCVRGDTTKSFSINNTKQKKVKARFKVQSSGGDVCATKKKEIKYRVTTTDSNGNKIYLGTLHLRLKYKKSIEWCPRVYASNNGAKFTISGGNGTRLK